MTTKLIGVTKRGKFLRTDQVSKKTFKRHTCNSIALRTTDTKINEAQEFSHKHNVHRFKISISKQNLS